MATFHPNELIYTESLSHPTIRLPQRNDFRPSRPFNPGCSFARTGSDFGFPLLPTPSYFFLILFTRAHNYISLNYKGRGILFKIKRREENASSHCSAISPPLLATLAPPGKRSYYATDEISVNVKTDDDNGRFVREWGASVTRLAFPDK